MNGKKKGIMSTWISLGIIAVVFLALGIFLLTYRSDRSATDVASVTPTPNPGTLAFTAPSYEVEAKQETDMTRYLSMNGLKAEDVSWASDSSQVIVGSNGRIVINDYGVNCNLTAKSKADDKIASTCQVRTRSERDDLVYSVQNLNGENAEDSTQEDGTVVVAADTNEGRVIDVDADNRKPGKRSGKYKWDRTLFYMLEDASDEDDTDNQINTYRIERKQFTNKATKNEMEYEIYHHPESDKINKIVSIEHEKNKLLMTEYYYTDSGKVNFIYCYEDVNYVPTYAQLDKKGQRFLFHKDTMVNWRIVDKKGERNYCYGKKEKEALEGHSHIKEYSSFSKKKKAEYDKKEKQMINRAYNTLEKVKNFEGVNSIRGYISDAGGNGVNEATVKLRSKDFDCEVFGASTNDKGYYEIFVPARESTYEIGVQKDSYVEEKLYDIVTADDKIGVYQETVYLAENEDTRHPCTIRFYDALQSAENGDGMMPVEGADVTIRRGANNKTGEKVSEFTAEQSTVHVDLTPGMYTVQMSLDGYMDSYNSLFVSKDAENEVDIYATPQLAEDEIRIVLTWGDTPQDLDSHLFTPGSHSERDADYHVAYYQKDLPDGKASLDVDDTTGYGPETTTIYHLERGQYKYYVADFTNCSRNNETSYEMSQSSATVRVYGKDGLMQTFYVPVNRSGVLWEVFEIRDGNLVPLQRYYDVIGDKTWWSSGK